MTALQAKANAAIASLRKSIPKLNIPADKDPRLLALADLEAYVNAPPPEPKEVQVLRAPTETELSEHLEKVMAAEGLRLMPITPLQEPSLVQPAVPVPAPPTVERPKVEEPAPVTPAPAV